MIDIQEGSKEKQEDVEMEDCNNIDNINECNEDDLIPYDPEAEGKTIEDESNDYIDNNDNIDNKEDNEEDINDQINNEEDLGENPADEDKTDIHKSQAIQIRMKT
jgi:hypothetical protein